MNKNGKYETRDEPLALGGSGFWGFIWGLTNILRRYRSFDLHTMFKLSIECIWTIAPGGPTRTNGLGAPGSPFKNTMSFDFWIVFIFATLSSAKCGL